jgi:alkylhydroperoxidase/carboxymuconolactone decarboxylase family protein YurZ
MSLDISSFEYLYKAITGLNEAAYTGKVLDYRTQKLIAVGINAAASDERATKKQMMSAMKKFDITKDEIVDVLRVVFLTSGMPPFTKAMKILYELVWPSEFGDVEGVSMTCDPPFHLFVSFYVTFISFSSLLIVSLS